MNYRNATLIGLARIAPRCFGCGKHNEGDVVAAHANWGEMGKSAGSKAHDFAVAFLGALCCHAPLDQGRAMSREDRKAFWMAAHWRTMEWLWASGYVAAHTEPVAQPVPKPKFKRAMPKGRKLTSGAKLQGRAFSKADTPRKIPSKPFPKRAPK